MLGNIYQHFRQDEAPFIERINENLINVQENYTPFLTDFLNPREAWILETLLNRFDETKLAFFGGQPDAESRRAFIFPSFMEIDVSDFKLALLEITYPQKFATLKHSQVLGTVLAQGIERSKVGDILSENNQFQVVVDERISDYLIQQVNRIGLVKVRLKKVDLSDIIKRQDIFVEDSLTISSLRLDILISKVYNISRERSKKIIEHGQAKLNFQIIEKVNHEIEVADLISVRGFGRFKLQKIHGLSKKGKIKVIVEVLDKH